ncbi:MAG: hypothetical protein HQ537_01540 [Parcubacteria group bacterium]|nr:hypothetical protein [Parcubacteria group bacterium]
MTTLLGILIPVIGIPLIILFIVWFWKLEKGYKITIIAIIIVVLGVFLVLSVGKKNNLNLNKKQQLSSLNPSGSNLSVRHLSGIIDIPAGTGIYYTGVFSKKGDWGYFKSGSTTEALLWDDKRKKSLKVPCKGKKYPCTKDGELMLVKQALPTKITYEIISRT